MERQIFQQMNNARDFIDYLKKSPSNLVLKFLEESTTPIGVAIVITDGTNNYNVFTRKGVTLKAGDIATRDGIRVWFSGSSFVLRHFINID